jgi:hypothetical protein
MEGISMRELLTRRIGPAPVWLYFIVLVIGGVIFIRWRAGKKPAKTSSVPTSPNLTTSPGALIPYASDVFVNIQQGAGRASFADLWGPEQPQTNPGNPVMPPLLRNRTPNGQPIPGGGGVLLGGIGPDGRRRMPTNGYAPLQGGPADASRSLAVPARQASITYPVSAAMIAGINSRSTDEAIARQHGYSSVGGVRWLFSGDKVMIPT